MADALPSIEPDWEGFLRNLRREGTPPRVFFFEHGVDPVVQTALDKAFGTWRDIDPSDANAEFERTIATYRFLGLELVRVFPPGARIVLERDNPWEELSRGPVTDWQSFEAYPWPRAADADLTVLEYCERSLPPTMRAMHLVDVWEVVRALFGFETFCFALYEEPDLVHAVVETVGQFAVDIAERVCDFDCYGAFYLSDDLGHRTSTMIAPDTIRALFMPWHRKLADIAHRHGKLFLFHSCGQMYELMDAYIDDVGIDAKHSFEEAVMPVTEVSRRYGERVGLLGGMDVDLLARGSEHEIRAHTRAILDACVPGGGYCLGAGNWVTSYIPLDRYLAMVDEGRRY